MSKLIQVETSDIARGLLLRADVLAGRLDAFRVVTLSKADAYGFIHACFSDASVFESVVQTSAREGVPIGMSDLHGEPFPEDVGPSPDLVDRFRRKDAGDPLVLPIPARRIYLATRGAARALVRGSVASSSASDWQPIAGAPGEASPIPGIALPGLDQAAALAVGLPALDPLPAPEEQALGALPAIGALGTVALTVGGVAAIAAGAWYLADRHRANVGLEVEKMKLSAEIALRTTAISQSIAAGKPIDPELVRVLAPVGQSEERSGVLWVGGTVAVLGLVAAGAARAMGKI